MLPQSGHSAGKRKTRAFIAPREFDESACDYARSRKEWDDDHGVWIVQATNTVTYFQSVAIGRTYDTSAIHLQDATNPD